MNVGNALGFSAAFSNVSKEILKIKSHKTHVKMTPGLCSEPSRKSQATRQDDDRAVLRVKSFTASFTSADEHEATSTSLSIKAKVMDRTKAARQVDGKAFPDKSCKK